MAHTIIGLDLGSCVVKAIVVRMAMRGSEIIGLESEPVTLDENGRSKPSDVLEATGRLVERLNLDQVSIYCAVPGELAAVRQIHLPTSAAKRLEQVLRFELDETLPFDIEDAVFDFVEVSRNSDEIVVLAASMLRDNVQQMIDGLGECGIDPNEIGVSPFSYRSLHDAKASAEDELAAFVDIGHLRTTISVLDTRVPTGRTILRGGRDLTDALAQKGKVSFEEAEQYKQQHGLDGQVGVILNEAIRPLIREIRQTLKGHLAAGGGRVTKVLLAGGGAKLSGLVDLLQDELGVPVERYGLSLGQSTALEASDQHFEFALTHALARQEILQRSQRINLRQGELSFRGDYEFLKRRIAWAAGCLLAILLAWIFSSYAEYRLLADKAETQRKELTEITTRIFNKPVVDRLEIERLLGGKQIKKAPMPEIDAFDIIVELSRRIPTSVVHDVERLEIKPKRITLKGIVDAQLVAEGELTSEQGDAGVSDGGVGSDLSPTDLIKQKLEGYDECFTAIRVGKVTVIGERRRYQMDIDSKCP